MSAQAATHKPQRDEQRLTDTLLSVADELERTRALGLRVEQAVIALAVNSSVDVSVVAELQNFDAVLQQIAALRDFLAQLSAGCASSAVVDLTPALARVTLEDVKTRLAGAYANEMDEAWEIL